MVVGIDKVILNKYFELRIGYLSQSVNGKLILEKIPWCSSRNRVKALVPYFKVLQVGFVKRSCDANLVLCSRVLDARMKTCEKTEGCLLIMFIDEQTITWD